MTLSHPFLEGSTAKTVTQVAAPLFCLWINPEMGCWTQPEWSWYCTLKNLDLPTCLSQLLAEPLLILVLSSEFTFLVAPALARIYFTTYKCNFEFKGPFINNGWWRSNLVTTFWFNDVKSVKIIHIFYREGTDPDQVNFEELKSRT
jgi:hypothetical protein